MRQVAAMITIAIDFFGKDVSDAFLQLWAMLTVVQLTQSQQWRMNSQMVSVIVTMEEQDDRVLSLDSVGSNLVVFFGDAGKEHYIRGRMSSS